MNKNLLTLALIIAIALIFNSCAKKDCTLTYLGTFNFTQAEINIIPYNGNETLLFTDSLGNLLTGYGIGRGSNEQEQDNFIVEHPSEQPCGYYLNTEYNYTTYQGTVNKLSIILVQSMDKGNPFGKNIKKYLNIQVSYTDIKTWVFNCTYNFDASGIYVTSDTAKNVLSFKNNLKFGSNTYKSVYELTQIHNRIGADFIQTVFYTFNQGIVAFKTNTGRLWYFSK